MNTISDYERGVYVGWGSFGTILGATEGDFLLVALAMGVTLFYAYAPFVRWLQRT